MALGYHQALGVVQQTPIDLTTMMGWNTINRILENTLGKSAYLKEVASYKRNERKMRWGGDYQRSSKLIALEIVQVSREFTYRIVGAIGSVLLTALSAHERCISYHR